MSKARQKPKIQLQPPTLTVWATNEGDQWLATAECGNYVSDAWANTEADAIMNAVAKVLHPGETLCLQCKRRPTVVMSEYCKRCL